MHAVSEPDARFEALLEFMQRQRGFDFTGYKRPSLMRRIRHRMETARVADFADYRDYLEVHPEEFALLFNTILINVTSFFRDPQSWEFLVREVIPPLLRDGTEEVRIWSAGCASGQEAYTLAIVLAEALGEPAALRERVKIYATDVDDEALAQARQGLYSAKELEGIPAALQDKYFEPLDGRFAFRGDLRRSVIFGRHDLVQDAPISRLDLLVCRNTLMYFNAEAQAKILARFHFALRSEAGRGILFLGRAEMLLTHGGLFKPIDLKHRVFAKVAQFPARQREQSAATAAGNGNGADMTKNNRLRELALEQSPVPCIVVDANGIVAMATQRARTMFSLKPKDIGRPLQDLELSYRPAELRSLLEQAYAERRAVTLTSVERRFPDGEVQYLDIVVQPIFDETLAPLGAGITFFDVTRYALLQEELQRAREEVQTANEELQSSNEELETTNEELQSSNEELETTNEELQSTNEELETMNEELQSTNEELQTLNEELRQRTEEAGALNHFLKSVLASVRSGAVAVNRNLDVTMWNHRAEDLWGLRAEEVQGKSLLNLDIGLPVNDLRNIARACEQLDGGYHETILEAVNRRGKPIKCRIVCSALMAGPNKREGMILLMDEID
jgi:two-component system CheB/CheR fusion protein